MDTHPDMSSLVKIAGELQSQSEVAAQCFSDTIFALINIPDEELQEYIESTVLELSYMDTDVEVMESPEWRFVCKRVIGALRIAQALFVRAQDEVDALR